MEKKKKLNKERIRGESRSFPAETCLFPPPPCHKKKKKKEKEPG
jgi:hypothetical protein